MKRKILAKTKSLYDVSTQREPAAGAHSQEVKARWSLSKTEQNYILKC